MPAFLRLFTSTLPFRRSADDIQPSRRVITKTTPAPETRLRTRLSQLNLSLHPAALDAASTADSDVRAARPILAPSVRSFEPEGVVKKEGERGARRRLSKRHRMPGRV